MEFSRCARSPAHQRSAGLEAGLSKLSSVHVEVDVLLGEPDHPTAEAI